MKVTFEATIDDFVDVAVRSAPKDVIGSEKRLRKDNDCLPGFFPPHIVRSDRIRESLNIAGLTPSFFSGLIREFRDNEKFKKAIAEIRSGK